ncbi:MAG: glutamate-1-semialdehyde 2,1-aminomutase [Methanospirillum sp.]|mgnify:CR=1 FL=1|nr:glutamate-1-semialdehyde 2,1-aminomutase [Methanospirillum sp.]
MRSADLYREAVRLMPGGVSSPVRAISPCPFYTASGKGAYLETVDGFQLLDCCLGYGPLILGHGPDVVREAIEDQVTRGWLFGTPTPLEIDLAREIIEDHRSIEQVRFVSTGAEATMAAIRVARGFSGKSEIVKIEGGFHGAHDSVLVKAGSGATTFGVPDSAGVLPAVAARTLQVPFNDPDSLEDLLAADGDVAALIIEPVLGNIGPILPEDGYLEAVREITRAHDVLLIFDEVITGYRLGIGGAQTQFDVDPDLTTLGKVVGGGLPIGVFGGREEIMALIAPSGPVYQAGTFSGNPLSLAAGLASIRWLKGNRGVYARLEEATRALQETMNRWPGSFVRCGSLFKHFFRTDPPANLVEARQSSTKAFRLFWERMLQRGIFLPPSQFETNFISTAHGEKEMADLEAAYRACLS